MSLISDLKTFASKVEAELVKLFKKAPQVLQIASAVVTYVAPLIEGFAALSAPAASAAIDAAITTIETDLATLAAAAKTVDGSATAAQAVTNLQASVPNLLSVVKVEDTSLVADVEKIVALIAPELVALATALA